MSQSINFEGDYHGILKEGYHNQNVIINEKMKNNKPFNEWSRKELYELAKKIGISGRSFMNKKSLIKSLQNN